LGLEKMGLSYDLKLVNFRQGEQKAEAFKALNVNGKVPVLVDHEGPRAETRATNCSSNLV
jgi:GST-like protein